MTDAKKYLQQIQFYDSQINAKLAERDRLKEMLTKITPTLRDDAVSGGHGSQDKLSDAVAKIVDLEAEIDMAVDSFVDARKSVSKVIDKVADNKQFNILHRRYVLDETFEQIAADMGYTYRWICSMHGEALKTVEKILKSEKSS